MLSVVDAGNLGDGHVDEAALVRVERAELLIDAGLLRLLGQELRHLPQLDVLAFAVGERIDEHALVVRRARPNAMSTTCCSALSGSPRCRTSSSASSPDRLSRGPSAVCSTSTAAFDAERGGEPRQELDDRVAVACLPSLRSLLARAASVLPPPTRFTRRSAGGRTLRTLGGPIR